MKRTTKIGAGVAAGAAAAVAVAAIAVASPKSETSAADQTPSPTTTTAPDLRGDSGMRVQERALTGADAEKATAAALEAVPGGTVLRVETDGDGGATYEAHVRKSDGTEVVVQMDASFTVTGVEEFSGRGGHGPMSGSDRSTDDSPSSGSTTSSSFVQL